MDDYGHWLQDAPQCQICDFHYPSEKQLKSHQIEDPLYCAECNRTFRNGNNIQQHLNSALHRPKADINCPFCARSNGTATGLVHHLERGACPNAPLDRDTLYRAIRQRDPDGVISKKMLEWHGSDTYEATSRAWNSRCSAYECYLCHQLFNTLGALNQHLASPRHQQNLYHCPGRSCGKEFSTLAALINHFESESCGFMRFQAVQTSVQSIVSSDRRIGF
ncbi:hypothetical protein QQZ08_006417 [Neonectria magnoliae]|uniref:C2H2-type domain-containing protein n=1 Tax=Neonectria magnoliae TaxID=2732573 RepID=A0ABR1I0C7_9HYPO